MADRIGKAELPDRCVTHGLRKGFLAAIERQYGKTRRIWVMDRGIPTEAVLEEMRRADPPVSYLVGTPKGRLSRLEQRRGPVAALCARTRPCPVAIAWFA